MAKLKWNDALEEAKKNKDHELNRACENTILAGFSYVINNNRYWFSYDDRAQGNFRDGRDILNAHNVDEIVWTVREGGSNGLYTRILINMDIMNDLTLKIMDFKMSNIGKYRDFLMPLVNEASTVQEVIDIKW